MSTKGILIAVSGGLLVGRVIFQVHNVRSGDETALAANSAPSGPGIGDVITLHSKTPSICGSSKDALDEILKWAVRRDIPEMTRTIITTRSRILPQGTTIKILDMGFMTTKVRVLDGGLGHVCFTPTETVTQNPPQ